MNSTNKLKTKKGAASLYVVTFVTLLLGIITLSFIRIMVASSARSNNTDLAQSALDSAQAGVEDARVALLTYHDCLSNPSKQGCKALLTQARSDIKNSSCDTVRNILQRTQGNDEEVIIQETKDSDNTNSDSMLQAYTCVKITEETPDYRTTLDDDSRIRLVPIRVDHSYLEKIDTISVKWYSEINKKANPTYGRSDGKMSSSATDVPVLSVQLFQTDQAFTLGELSVTNNAQDGTDHATVFLNPLSPGGDLSGVVSNISADTFVKTNAKGPKQKYFNVKCGDIASGNEFDCHVNIKFPDTFYKGERNEGSVFLVVAVPYGGSATDISVELKDSHGDPIEFVGVQALVDSTGRANDLYRRIETRLELIDIYYPYPENEVELSSEDEKSFVKNVTVAGKCWYTVAKSNGHTTVIPCPAVSSGS